MINREIVYERNMMGSFMKIPAGSEPGIDERFMLRRRLPGALPVEKAYVDGGGQYWYNISGKQSLDTYCREREIKIDFVEQLIISICGLMERLEWNLICANCLMLDPELVFVNHASREFSFTLYPGGNQTVEQEFQILMEYLMKKVDHKDAQAVRTVYRIYEQTLEEGYQIADIRSMLLREKSEGKEVSLWDYPSTEKTGRRQEIGSGYCAQDREAFDSVDTEDLPVKTTGKSNTKIPGTKREGELTDKATRRIGKKKTIGIRMEEKPNVRDFIKRKLTEWGIVQEVNHPQTTKKPEYRQEIVYPDDVMEIEHEPMPVIHPTVCLTGFDGLVRGELRYMGSEKLSDIQLREESICIGYASDADISINRETISRFHARIHKEDDGFYIEDLNSTNGTFINEEPLAYKEQRKLDLNDIVQFADIRYRFC